MTTISPPTVNRPMPERELRVVEEWGALSTQDGSSAPDLNPQAQGQTSRQGSGQTQAQPRGSQAHIPLHSQRQSSGQSPINSNVVVNRKVNGNVSTQKRPSQGRPQGYASNNVSTANVKRNGTTLDAPSRQLPQGQAPSRGRNHYQGYGAVNVKASDKPMNLALNQHANPNASLPRQPLSSQGQIYGHGRAVESYGSMGLSINATVNSNANPSAQMQAQDKTRGQSLRQGQGYSLESVAPGANMSGTPSAQILQTTHRGRNMGRNKRRNRGPTVFDEWKAQATREAAKRDEDKRDEPNTASDSKATISEAQIDATRTGSSPAKEGSKGRSGKKKGGKKNSGGGRRNRRGSDSWNNKANEKEPNPNHSRRHERACSSSNEAKLIVDAHTEKSPVDSASLSSTPSADTSTGNAAIGPKETDNLEGKDTAKTRSHKSSCSFSINEPKLATIGEENVSSEETKTGAPDAKAGSSQATEPSQSGFLDYQKVELESKPDGKEFNVCDGSKDITAASVAARVASPSGSTSLEHLEVDQAQNDNVSNQSGVSKVSATENEATALPTEMPASSKTLAGAVNQKEGQPAMVSASEVGHSGQPKREQKPTRSHQKSTGSISPGKLKPQPTSSI